MEVLEITGRKILRKINDGEQYYRKSHNNELYLENITHVIGKEELLSVKNKRGLIYKENIS